MGKPTIDKAALAEAVRKTAKLRVEDVGGDKSRPAETVRSCLNRGFSGLGSDEGLSYILRHAVKYYLAAATAREKAPVACGGCGETEPAKRCIGCLADFGPASLHQQETADDAMAGAAVHAIREMLNEIGVPQAAFIDDHVRNGLVWARRQALEEALAAAETVKNIPPESWEVSLVVRAIRELIDAKEQGGHA